MVDFKFNFGFVDIDENVIVFVFGNGEDVLLEFKIVYEVKEI